MSHATTGLIAALFLPLCAADAAAEPAVTSGNLNLRSGPGPAFGVVAVMPAGAKLDVLRCNDRWCRVKLGRRVGYGSRDLLKIGVDSYASAAASPAAPAPKPRAVAPRIWQWRNSEWRDAHWRQLDWHNRLNRR